MKIRAKEGDLIVVKSQYFIGNKIDHSNQLLGKVAIVIRVSSYGHNSLFGPYYHVYAFCGGGSIKLLMQDVCPLKTKNS